MGVPTVFSGIFCKLLNSGGVLRKNGHIINYDGSRNYVANNHAEINTTGWATYADAAGSVPVDATGGAPTTTWTRSTTSPLSGNGSFLLTKDAANRQGEGVSYDFTIDSADKSRQMRIACDLEGSAAFVTGDSSDVRIFIYDVTNAVLIYPNRYTINIATGRFEAQWDSSSSTSYRLVFHIATANASAWTLKVDNVIVGITQPVFGFAGSNYQEYTPTFTGFGTVSNIYARYARVGSAYHFQIRWTNGTATATEARVSLPTSIVASSTAYPVLKHVGSIVYSGTGVTTYSVLALGGNSYVNFGQTSSGAGNGLVAVNGNELGSSTSFSFNAIVEIQGLDANVTLSNSATFYISSILANGTRVTSTPTQLGEYRTYVQSASTGTGTDNAPTTGPSAANGMRLYAGPVFASAGTSGETNRWEIFVGRNKNVFFETYENTGRTGGYRYDYFVDGNVAEGVKLHYNPTTGIFIVDAIATYSVISSDNRLGRQLLAAGAGTAPVYNAYFDLKISENALGVGISRPYTERVIARDEKTSGTDGGTFTSGSWQTRTLNTLVNPNAYSWITLASNQVTLSPGKYFIRAKAPCTGVNRNQSKIRNTTDSSDALIGTSCVASSVDGDNAIFSFVDGEITITGTKTFELQHQCQTTRSTNGFGNNANMGVTEVFSVIEIEKLV